MGDKVCVVLHGGNLNLINLVFEGPWQFLPSETRGQHGMLVFGDSSRLRCVGRSLGNDTVKDLILLVLIVTAELSDLGRFQTTFPPGFLIMENF